MEVTSVRQRSVVKNSRISFADMAHQSIVLQNDSAQWNHESVCNNDGIQEMTPCSTETRSGAYVFPSTSSSRKKNGTNCTDSVATFSFPGYLRLLACLAMAVIATIVFEFMLIDFSLTFQKPLLLAMQSFCFVFLFFVLAIYLRSAWTNESICATLCVCVAVEIIIGYAIAQNKLDSDIVQPLFTFVVLICVGGVSMYSSQDIVRSALVITGISIVRFLACAMITDLPRWLRPVLVYCSGAVGVLAARYTVVALRSVTTCEWIVSDKRRDENNISANHTVCGNVQPCVATRRISLPNLMRKNAVSSSVSIESTLLMKADGLLTDIIADPSVPRQILRGLRAVQTLLKQSSPTAPTHRSKSIPLVSLSSSTFASQTYADLPYTDDYIHFYSNKNLHRSLPSAFSRCRSAGSWTTTTSATGMPSLESELLHRTKFHQGSESNSFSPLDKNWAVADERTDGQLSGEMWPVDRCSSSECESDAAEGGRPVHGNDATANFILDEQDLQGPDVGTSSLKSHGAGSAAAAGTKHHHIKFADSTDSSKRGSAECNSESKIIDIFDELDNDALMDVKLLNRWDYPIFDFAAKAPDTILCRVAYKIFNNLGFFETFSIPVQEFLNYFHSLELGYHNNPYHNRIHATDVLHAVFYMTVRSIPGFIQVTPDDDYKSPDTEPENVFFPVSSNVNLGTSGTETCMRTNFLPLELMALYTAAAMHDYDHPGRTNAFLVSTCNPLAVLYNNRSVLENHHASAGWQLLLSSPRYAWLLNLNDAQFKRFRFLVIEAVLATDLARHFDLLAEFNAKANDDDAAGIDWTLEADRQMVSNMVIKMADINGPCKPKDLHIQWTERISEEFYEQGDEEAGLGLVISPYMNRHQPQLAKLQESFITHLVAPLCNSLGSAGLLPGHGADETEEGVSSPVDSNNEDPCTKRLRNHKNCCHGDLKFVLGGLRMSANHTSSKKVRKIAFESQLGNVDFICPMIQNLEANHQMWVKMIKVETVQQEEAEHHTVESNIPCEDEKPVSQDSGAN